MLILLDIDGTLLTTTGVGRNSMAEAGRRAFQTDFDIKDVSFAGRLDPLIIRDLLTANGQQPTPDNEAAMRKAYFEVLSERITEPNAVRALDGAHALVDRLTDIDGIMLGLLTGNFPETGERKINAVGFEVAQFAVPVWGDMSPHEPPHRDHLPPIGMDLYTQRTEQAIDPDRVLIIGDTPHDIRCAKTNGCRVIAVGSGHTEASELATHDPDLTLESLADTDRVVEWITSL